MSHRSKRSGYARSSTSTERIQMMQEMLQMQAENQLAEIEAEKRKLELEAEQRRIRNNLKFDQLKIQFDTRFNHQSRSEPPMSCDFSDANSEHSSRDEAESEPVGAKVKEWAKRNAHLLSGTINDQLRRDYFTLNGTKEVSAIPVSTKNDKGAPVEFSKTGNPGTTAAHTSTPADVNGAKHVSGVLDPECTPFKPSRPSSTQKVIEMDDGIQPFQLAVQALNSTLAYQQELNRTNLLPTMKLERFNGDYTQFSVFQNSFVWHVENNTDDPQRRLTHLYNTLDGAPKRLIEGCLHLAPDYGYTLAWEILCRKYKNNDELIEEYIKKLFAWKDISSGDYEALEEYHSYLFKVQCALGDNYMRMELKETMRKLVSKLPYNLRVKFISKHESHGFTLPALIAFIQQEVDIARHLKYFEIERITLRSGSKKMDQLKKQPLPVHATQPAPDKEACLYCGKNGHELLQCFQFKRLDVADKWKAVRPTRLCFRCLKAPHSHRRCPETTLCDKCGVRYHHTMLHRPVEAAKGYTRGVNGKPAKTEIPDNGKLIKMEPPVSSTKPLKTMTAEMEKTESALPLSVVTEPNPDGRTMLKLLPVIAGDSATTYAFIDGGAVPTLVTRSLVEQLGIKGRKCHQVMRTECGDFTCDEVVSIRLSSIDGEEDIQIDEAFVTPSISVTTDHLMPVQWISNWPHLSDVILQRLPQKDAGVDLIVGLNSSLNRHILDQRHGTECEPSAYRTKLGWVVFGPTGPKCPNIALVNHIQPQEDIAELLRINSDRDFWEKEALSTTENSYEDEAFLNHVSKTISHRDGQYCVALPFRDSVSLPNNRKLAARCAISLKRKLEKNKAFKESYVAQIEDYIQKKYAESVPSNMLTRDDGRVWYLTHHAVQHPTKPKIRVVFNPKARYKGHSLNEHLMQGPDLTNSLVGVLLRFKNGRYAVTADIKEMFHQVRVLENDKDVFRFLWWPGGDTSSPLCEFRMASQIFGATSSPSIVNYCLRRTADDFGEKYEDEVSRTIYRHFYVDNLLKATDDEEACVSLVHGLIRLCSEGGFRLNQWTSNNKKILAMIPETERDESVAVLDLTRDELPIERTLGIYWSMENDSFTFRINLKNKPLTRRGVLSVVSSLYDPLGLVSPVTLQGKMLLQEICRLNLAWDAEMPQKEAKRWQAWVEQLPQLSDFNVRRSLTPVSFGKATSYQLHHFADASQAAYGVVSYLRIKNAEGLVECVLLMSRARVAPLKRPSVPRLELTAATVAAQVDIKLKAELDLNLDESVFWTDSTTVLKYLNNKRARYQTFVANRVNLIRDLTQVFAWRYVDTVSNPADIASRGMNVENLLKSTMWLNGPDFLCLGEESWPPMPVDVQHGSLVNDPEVKQDTMVFDITVREPCFIERLAEHFSAWVGFVRHVAWLLRFYNNAAKLHNDKHCTITVEEVQRAEAHIYRLVQEHEYHSEIASLSGKLARVKKTSKILRLHPFLHNRLLRVGGRLEKSCYDVEAKHPIILPHMSPVVKLLVRWIHVTNGHCGQNHLMARLRERYWIVHGNSIARSIIRNCVVCRRLSSRPVTQLMAALPEDRTCPDQPPFTHTGSDCFGPFLTKRGRSTVKRWGAIFTCMTSRAVHVEMLENMDTDAYLNALRRFMSRRGPVKKIWTDNGTNLVATEKELREALQKFDQTKIENALNMKGIEWHFSPPYASNFGGVWERLIRSIRRALGAACQVQVLTDDSLATLFCEAEAVVNSRPLTRVNDDPTCLQPLSPSSILTMKDSVGPMTETTPKDLYVRRRWRQVQHLADVFWKRWLKEYIPLLQERQRWHIRRRDLKPGDVVMTLDEKLPRGTWPLGRVTEVIKSSDGHVRSVKVKTEKGVYHRPVNKLCILLESEIENQI